MTKRFGNTVMIEHEPMAVCEYCQRLRELRPYGKNGERICIDCASKPENIEAATAQRDARFHGTEKYIMGPQATKTMLKAGAVTILELHCPHCDQPITGFSPNEKGGVPGPGDANICHGCARMSIFTSDMHGLRLPTPAELEQLPRQYLAAQLVLLEQLRRSGQLRPVKVKGGGP